MENNFENRDFEHFVKQNADQYRMFPSEKVWKGINNKLHIRRRWYGIGLALLLLTTATVTGIMLNTAEIKQQISANSVTINSSKDNQVEKPEPGIYITAPKKLNKKSSPAFSPDQTQKNLFSSTKNEEIELTEKPSTLSAAENTITENTTEQVTQTVVLPKLVVTKRPINNQPLIKLDKIQQPIAKKVTTATITTLEPEETAAPEVEENSSEQYTIQESPLYPMTIESVINAYKKTPKTAKKVSWQVYVTPSITYRKLDENKPFLDAARTSLPSINTTGVSQFYSFADINRLVTHKPDIGLQLGVSAGYPISKNITLKAGLQFNVSKYNIMATSHPNEVAVVALSNSSGGRNTISTVSNLRNVAGYKSAWLHNKYISASIPIGAEFKFSNKKRTSVGIAGSVEPTYVLGNRAYILSTDLKNYAKIPSLTRNWNINTGFEIFATYNTGNIDWRIGPQFRYQLLSSFNNTYPIKENLFDFGIKLGVMLK